MRNLDLAKAAYSKGDPALSRAVHEKRPALNGAPGGKPEEGHAPFGDFVKSIVYGGLDGVLTSFAICSGAAGGRLPPRVVLVLGLSGAVANGLAMGLGDALSTKAEQEHVLHERQREFWEYDHYKQGEIEEMIELYVDRGMSREDAERVIGLIADHRAFFVDVMTVEELGLQLPTEDNNPWKDGLVTFVSFMLFGLLPVMGYSLFPMLDPGLSPDALYFAACMVTGVTLFLLGSVAACFSPKPWWRGGLEMVLVGTTVSLIAFGVGSAAESLAGEEAKALVMF